MEDPIIDAYLRDFVREFGLDDVPESTAFEHFVNHCVISRHHSESFEPDEVFVGGGGDLGIDGLGIVVNEHLVHSQEDVDFFKASLRRLDGQFIFRVFVKSCG